MNMVQEARQPARPAVGAQGEGDRRRGSAPCRGRPPARGCPPGRRRRRQRSPSPWLRVDPRRAAGSPGSWRPRTARRRSAATTPRRTAPPARRAARRSRRPTSPASEIRALALTRVKPRGSSRGTAAARVTPYALEATSTPSAAGNSHGRVADHRGGQHPAQEGAQRHRRADRPAPAVAEPVEERARSAAPRSRTAASSGRGRARPGRAPRRSAPGRTGCRPARSPPRRRRRR